METGKGQQPRPSLIFAKQWVHNLLKHETRGPLLDVFPRNIAPYSLHNPKSKPYTKCLDTIRLNSMYTVDRPSQAYNSQWYQDAISTRDNQIGCRPTRNGNIQNIINRVGMVGPKRSFKLQRVCSTTGLAINPQQVPPVLDYYQCKRYPS